MNDTLSYSGFHHPDCPGTPKTLAQYLEWYSATRHFKDRHVIGLFFSRHLKIKGYLEGINTLITELESSGLIPAPLFSQPSEHAGADCPGYNHDLNLLKGADAVINCVSSFLYQSDITGDQAPTVLDLIDTPVFQAVTSSGRSEQEWRSSPQGLSAMNQVYSVAQPEFNGTIEPTVMFWKSPENGGYGPSFPIPDRIRFMVRRIQAWLRLRDLPKEERRITVLLHNNPCHGTEASLGGANGLDSFESVVKVMEYLSEQGYRVENRPESGKELSDLFLERKAISEFRWTTVQEIVDRGGATDFVSPETYDRYFNELSPENREKMIQAWGEPPGKSMVLDNRMVVTGLEFGNVRVMAEPKRGCYGSRCDGQVCRILHDPEVPPTHQCLATFRWIQEHSDVIVSCGTHGYIEFLPGKACGMTSECFPEIITGPVPHLYIYTSRNPNEAILAKRRAYATVVDHAIPAMESAQPYDGLEELESTVAQFTAADQLSEAGRKQLLSDSIRKQVLELNLLPGLDKEELTLMDDKQLAARVHEALFLVRDSVINNGLHILGQTHPLDTTVSMIQSILKYDGNLPSIRRCVLDLMGEDYDAVTAITGSASTLEECNRLAALLITNVLSHKSVHDPVLSELFPGTPNDSPGKKRLLALLAWIRNTLYPNLMKTALEIPQIGRAMESRYISPGPGGTLTRGKTDILPTGRNLYSIDPRKIPTRAAHAIGVVMADELLKKSMEDTGRYPEKIGMVLWSLDAFRADGEQLAQILHLMGARPVWNETGLVTGVEPIPLAELKRPRIDVTVRTSEIFRDTLPNLIELLDMAVVMIANLEEGASDNFIRKTTDAYRDAAREKGSELKGDALDRAATFRVFAAKPGTFGNGIKLMIAASAWQTVRDLGETFIEHGGYAYGKDVFGQESHHEFAHNLKSITTVFHKMETDETDPLGCCYNDFQGGMTAAVRALSDITPKVMWGDTRNPSRPAVRELKEEIERVVRAKLLNPRWIDGMKRHGYKGAQDMVHKASSVFGWDATSDVIDDWVFDEITRKHVLDPEMRSFYEQNNPWALEELSRRFLEAESRGLWDADPQVLQDLRESYLETEGWIEDKIGDVTGEFQGGSVDILTRREVDDWKKKSAFSLDSYLAGGTAGA
ncbi:MAG: cobaltochelatase subunit CobN [Pseudomonadota bacterium]